MKPVIRHLAKVWTSEWSLTAFLVMLVLTVFVVVPLSRLLGVGTLLVTIFFSLLLISGVAAVSERKTPTLFVTGLVIVTLILRWLTHLVPSTAVQSASVLSAIACLGLMAGVVMLQVFRKGPVTLHRIQGAIAVYLLLGVMWGYVYQLALLQIPDAFQAAELGGNQNAVISNLVYFSFVTLTTVGYGDITPVHPIVRSLATLEALVGQLYPAILIGRLVSIELQSRRGG